ncbi:MAG: SMP-30/gluconolactonase/LRE family protein [Verrucomicrobiales bacterium]|nr:SMP-30/gluconolactonase/LRE family protein [Verrucomicrobiales bacterium]
MIAPRTPCLLAVLLGASCALAAETDTPPFSGSIERLDPALDALIAPGTSIEVLASGFNWSEGPVWMGDHLLFSDVPENTVFRWAPGDKQASAFLHPSGSAPGTESDRPQGSNGLARDAQGHLILCQHGNRQVARLEKDGSFTPLAATFEGKRFNSPNDLVIHPDGSIYFTDPSYGLKGGPDSPLRELDFHGVFRLAPDGQISLVDRDLTWPNGIALSPNAKTLYVAVSDKDHPHVHAYDLAPDGSVKNGRVLFDATPLKSPDRKGGCDGLKIDRLGNIWTTGPGGVLILSSDGKHLSTILTGQATANCAWGDTDGRSLYITADMFLLRVPTLSGAPPPHQP